jgi:hypothetical protein
MGTIASYTTPDGYTIRVFDSMYLDYGIAIIRPDGTEGYYSPHALSSESYGSSEDEETGEVTPVDGSRMGGRAPLRSMGSDGRLPPVRRLATYPPHPSPYA